MSLFSVERRPCFSNFGPACCIFAIRWGNALTTVSSRIFAHAWRGQVTLIALFNGTLALYLLTASYVFIGFLFDLHKDHQS